MTPPENNMPHSLPPGKFSFWVTGLLMFVTWIVLSGNFSALLVGLGVLSSLAVAWFFHDLLFPELKPANLMIFVRFLRYLPWLVLEIIRANFHLLYLVFHPRMTDLIDPHTVQFATRLSSDMAITTLANSITLTPGTITITVNSEGLFRVHAIDKATADSLPGLMGDKVARIYGERI